MPPKSDPPGVHSRSKPRDRNGGYIEVVETRADIVESFDLQAESRKNDEIQFRSKLNERNQGIRFAVGARRLFLLRLFLRGG